MESMVYKYLVSWFGVRLEHILTTTPATSKIASKVVIIDSKIIISLL
jgi:hypothetical protein